MIRQWLEWIRRGRGRPGRPFESLRRPPRHRRPCVEQVEHRLLLSGTAGSPWDEAGFIELAHAASAAVARRLEIEADGEFVICFSAGKSGSRGLGSVHLLDGTSAGAHLCGEVYHASSNDGVIVDDHSAPAEPADSGPPAPVEPEVEMVRFAPEDLLASRREGGMIDLTRVVNERVRQARWIAGGPERGSAAGSASDRIGAEGSEDRPDSLALAMLSAPSSSRSSSGRLARLGSPFGRIEGSRGVFQAFELAMSPGHDNTAGASQDAGRIAPAGWPAGEAARSGGLTPAQNAAEDSPDGSRGHRSRDALGAAAAGQSPIASSETLIVREDRLREKLEELAPPDASEHDAFFADLDEPFGDIFWDAVYLDDKRLPELVPLLAVAILGQQLLKRHWPDSDRTCLIPPRRRHLDR